MKSSSKSLFEWWGSSEDLVKIGFTKSEIEDAFKKAKTKLSDITDDYNYAEANKNWEFIKNSPHHEILDENTSHIFEEWKGEWKREYTANAIQYRTRSNYGSFDGDILTALLKNKFPYFGKFKWEVFQMHGEAENWEIYLKTEFGSLYVPVKALLKKDPKLIIDRMTEYWSMYRHQDKIITKDSSEYQLNGHGMTLKQYQKQQEDYFKDEMKPLQSKEFEALKEALK